MKVIDHSLVRAQDGLVQQLQGHFQGISKFGFAWEKDRKAQEDIISYLGRYLDNRYHMLRGFTLPGQEQAVPLMLIGPPGMVVINASGEKGVFRAKGDSWTIMGRGSRQYAPASKNLLTETAAFADIVEKFLVQKGISGSSVQSVLMFSNTGIHVEASRPIVRILRADAIERYAASLEQSNVVLNQVQVQSVIDIIFEKPPAPVEKPAEEKAPNPVVERLASQSILPPALAKIKFSTKQWLVLAVVAGFEFIILVVFIFLILMTAGT